MIRKSNYKNKVDKSEIIQDIGNAVQLFQEATDAFDFVAAEVMGLNQTDLKCLSIILRKSPVPANEVASGLGLTRAAVTTALDRIESAGYAKRIRNPNDRRGVLLELTPKCKTAFEKLWGYLAVTGAQFLSEYTTAELETIQHFLVKATEMQQAHKEKIQIKKK